MNKTYYILVADAGAAKLYRTDGESGTPELAHERSNPAGRLTRSELESDRPGMQRNSIGGAHGLGGDNDAQKHESEQFARELCNMLKREHGAGRFTDLLIAAPPRFLGELREHLSGDCRKVLGKTVHKDLLRTDSRDLLSYFSEAAAPG
jgi:protein required for attachment to host cells